MTIRTWWHELSDFLSKDLEKEMGSDIICASNEVGAVEESAALSNLELDSNRGGYLVLGVKVR